MAHECNCSRPHQFSIHGNCNRCGGRKLRARLGSGHTDKSPWTKKRDFADRKNHGTVVKGKK